MTDFRALCAELVEKLDELNCNFNVPNQSALIERSCTALAKPESIKGRIAKADAAIEASMKRVRAIAAAPARALTQPEPEGPTDAEMQDLALHCVKGNKSVEWVIQEALARWGRPAIEPVPVDKRLPGPEDCDANGIVWAWDNGCLRWDTAFWDAAFPSDTDITHWLPHHALPVPQQEG
jgi:hypothetical protein